MALARSFSGSLPQTSANSLIFFGSTCPGPLPLPPLLSFCGLLAWMLLFGELPLPEPFQQPLPFCWFSISLIISSRRTTTSFCIFWVFLPPRVEVEPVAG